MSQNFWGYCYHVEWQHRHQQSKICRMLPRQINLNCVNTVGARGSNSCVSYVSVNEYVMWCFTEARHSGKCSTHIAVGARTLVQQTKLSNDSVARCHCQLVAGTSGCSNALFSARQSRPEVTAAADCQQLTSQSVSIPSECMWHLWCPDSTADLLLILWLLFCLWVTLIYKNNISRRTRGHLFCLKTCICWPRDARHFHSTNVAVSMHYSCTSLTKSVIMQNLWWRNEAWTVCSVCSYGQISVSVLNLQSEFLKPDDLYYFVILNV